MQGEPDVVSCLVPAAGSGQRLGLGPKAFLALRGRPLLHWTTTRALQVADEVLVAVPANLVEEATAMLPHCLVIAGGATRQDSIALLAARARGNWLMVHDAARPFASTDLFQPSCPQPGKMAARVRSSALRSRSREYGMDGSSRHIRVTKSAYSRRRRSTHEVIWPRCSIISIVCRAGLPSQRYNLRLPQELRYMR